MSAPTYAREVAAWLPGLDTPAPLEDGLKALGTRVLAAFGIAHPSWCIRCEADLTPTSHIDGEPDAAFVWHHSEVLPDDGETGVVLMQADVVTLDGRHLERRPAELLLQLPGDDGSSLTMAQTRRLEQGLSMVRRLVDGYEL